MASNAGTIRVEIWDGVSFRTLRRHERRVETVSCGTGVRPWFLPVSREADCPAEDTESTAQDMVGGVTGEVIAG